MGHTMGANDEKTEFKSNGLPDIKDPKPPVALFAGIFTVPVIIGLAIATAVYSFGATTKYDARISELASRDLHWAFLGLFVVGRAVAFVNIYPMYHKSSIMKANSGNLRSNPFIYKAIGDGAGEHAVIFDEEGAVGKYNRANRSLHHMVENFAVVVAGLFMVSQVFPFPVFVCSAIWGVGRALHQVGYTTGYGGHGAGFALAMLATAIIEGMAVVVGVQGLTP